MAAKPFSISAGELFARGRDDIPQELVSSKHLIYSSPATLAFNSPGAQGFGVKRAALAVPGSVMLLVSPACCGRNTTILGDEGGYSDKIFYLQMDESDIVTGRHLVKIPEAVREVCASLPEPPTVVMICVTCVDALLGTDMERLCRKASEEAGVEVRPCYMYALTREGVKPPMAAVRQAVYSMLEPAEKNPRAANVIGFFSPLQDDCELYGLLRSAGVESVREIGRCRDLTEYKSMAEANFNLVINPEARFAAEDMQKNLGIPYIELTRLYQIDKIERQYRLLGEALGVSFDDAGAKAAAEERLVRFRAAHDGMAFSIGESINAHPLELATALVRAGFRAAEIFATITPADFVWLKQLAALSPDTRLYSNLDPSMLYYDGHLSGADFALGRDAQYLHPELPGSGWNYERQPFGYAGLTALLDEIDEQLEGGPRS